MSSFDALKKNRKKSLNKLKEQIDKISSKSYADPNADKFWKPTRDKAGNAFAIIRFLPGTDVTGEQPPFVRVWDHGFQGPGGWYIEKSLTTIGKDDPVSQFNTMLWNRGDEKSKEQARKQKRRLKYISNIYVIKDSANPENEGKVFLYEYGKKVYDKINDLMFPQYDDEQEVNPFDLWEGANFRLKIRMYEGYPNYDKSEFDDPSALFDDDDKIEEVFNQQHSISEFLDEDNFKSYDELKQKLHRVLNIDQPNSYDGSVTAEDIAGDDEIDLSNLGKQQDAPTYNEQTYTPPGDTSDDDDDDLALFKELAKG